MAKKIIPNKKLARRCKACSVAGHNKATCPTATSAKRAEVKPKTSGGSPLKFFVHHVTEPAVASEHVIDLRTPDELWAQVRPIAPEPSNAPLYHFHHDAPPEPLNITLAATAPRHAPKIYQPQSPPPPPKADFSQRLTGLWRTQKTRVEKAPVRFSPYRGLAIKVAAGALAGLIILTVPRAALTYYENVRGSVAEITAAGLEGFTALADSLRSAFSGNLALAQSQNDIALQKLSAATALVRNEHPLLQTMAAQLPVVGPRVTSGQALLLAGQELALSANNIITALDQTSASSTLFERFARLANSLAITLPRLEQANAYLAKITSETLPANYQEQFANARQLLTAAIKDTQAILTLENSLKEIFGHNGRRTYLIVFQNEAELRPTGGFAGSFAEAIVKDGQLLSLTVPPGGSYDLQGQLDTTVEPPAPLTLANRRWEFQDANWWPDFPASAKKMLWFYRHSRAISADGIIAINSSVLTRLLSLLGPVPITNRDLTLTADTALLDLQTIVENGPEKKLNKPKQVLADAAPIILAQLSKGPADRALAFLSTLNTALAQKEIQAYFTDQEAENSIQRYGWGGALYPTSPEQDYLLVVNANVQGGKSDYNIKQTISHQALIEADGSIIDTVQITRANTGELAGPLYGLTNIDYLRLYVPAGSTLLSASGFSWPDEKLFRAPYSWATRDELLSQIETEVGIDGRSGTRVTKEFNKYAFGNWVITAPGTTSQIQFIYRLPFKAWRRPSEPTEYSNWAALANFIPRAGRYQLVLQKQSGINSRYSGQLILPSAWEPAWHNGLGITPAKNGAEFALPELHDTILSLAFKTK